MDDILAARSQMAMSLAFHIIFAAIGIAMPLLMVIAEWRFVRTKDEIYLTLAKRWAKGTAILFAVGAVSGTVLSFELGLLFPKFMAHAAASPVRGRGRGGKRRGVRDFRRYRQRVDEHADRFSPRRRAAGRYRPDRGDAESERFLASPAHDPGGLRGDRIRRRGHSRVYAAARSRQPFSSS